MRKRRLLYAICLILLTAGVPAVRLYQRFPLWKSDPVVQARTAYADGHWAEAARRSREILRTQPNDTEVLLLLARASAREGKDDTAEAIYRRLGTVKMVAEDLFLLGRGLIRRNQTGPGLASLRAARDLDPNHAETVQALASRALSEESLIPAERDAIQLSGQPGWELPGKILLARVRRQLLDPASAASLLTEALRDEAAVASIGENPAELQRLLAASRLEAGQPAQAIPLLRDAWNTGHDREAAWLLSRALLMDGQTAEAVAMLDHAKPQENESAIRRTEPSPFIGAARCERCHPREYLEQQQSHHAQTFKPRWDLASISWPEQPIVDQDNPQVIHTVHSAEEKVEIETRVSDRDFRAYVAFAVGSNHQGRSFIGREASGQARELRLSEYPSAPVWGRTMEHPAAPPNAEGYLGRPVTDEAARNCVHCHATNFRTGIQPEGRPEAADHGIGCERCHGPAAHHVRAVEEHFPDPAIARPRLDSAQQVVELCAQCHKSPGGMKTDSPGFIRFQAPTLVQSRCYTQSGTLSCTTCHDPHTNAGREPAEYETICLQCHPTSEGDRKTATLANSNTWPPCPTRAERGCLDCHMPRIKDAVPRTVFTDHFIRVRDDATSRTSK